MQWKQKNCGGGVEETCKYFNQINIKHKLDETGKIITCLEKQLSWSFVLFFFLTADAVVRNSGSINSENIIF